MTILSGKIIVHKKAKIFRKTEKLLEKMLFELADST